MPPAPRGLDSQPDSFARHASVHGQYASCTWSRGQSIWILRASPSPHHGRVDKNNETGTCVQQRLNDRRAGGRRVLKGAAGSCRRERRCVDVVFYGKRTPYSGPRSPRGCASSSLRNEGAATLRLYVLRHAVVPHPVCLTCCAPPHDCTALNSLSRAGLGETHQLHQSRRKATLCPCTWRGPAGRRATPGW